MVFVCMLMFWFGAAIWTGAYISLWSIGAVDAPTPKSEPDQQDHFPALATTRRHIHAYCYSSASMIIISTWTLALLHEKVTLPQAACSTSAAIYVLMLTFHVEHNPWPHQRSGKGALLMTLSMSAGSATLIVATLPLLKPAPNFAYALSQEMVMLTCGALVGVTLASSALMPLLIELLASRQEHILAAIIPRWALSMSILAAMLAIAGGDSARRIWPADHALGLLLGIGAVVPLSITIVLRSVVTIWLEAILNEMPIMGMRVRQLRVRADHAQQAGSTILRYAIGGAIVVASIAISLIVANIQLSTPPTTRAAPTKITMPVSTPTMTPVPAQKVLNLTQQNNGVKVSVTGGPFIIGNNVLHLTIHNTMDQPIPGASVLVIAQAMPNVGGGVAMQANPDTNTNSPAFSATITTSRSGVWRIVAIVATADQSIQANIVFIVTIPANA